MKSHRIEITMNRRRQGYKKNIWQTVEWLENTIPAIMKEKKLATETMLLKTINHVISICLS